MQVIKGKTVSRQVARAVTRSAAALEESRVVKHKRKVNARAKLERQAEREKSGFYAGTMAVANILGVNHGRRIRNKTEDDGKRRPGNLVRLA